jgi:hypothetical protein
MRHDQRCRLGSLRRAGMRPRRAANLHRMAQAIDGAFLIACGDRRPIDDRADGRRRFRTPVIHSLWSRVARATTKAYPSPRLRLHAIDRFHPIERSTRPYRQRSASWLMLVMARGHISFTGCKSTGKHLVDFLQSFVIYLARNRPIHVGPISKDFCVQNNLRLIRQVDFANRTEDAVFVNCFYCDHG